MSSVHHHNPNGGDAGSPSTSPSRSASISLHAAAAVNAGLQHEGSRRASFSPSCSSPFTEYTQPLTLRPPNNNRLLDLPIPPGHHLHQQRSETIPSPNEPPPQRSFPPRPWRNGSPRPQQPFQHGHQPFCRALVSIALDGRPRPASSQPRPELGRAPSRVGGRTGGPSQPPPPPDPPAAGPDPAPTTHPTEPVCDCWRRLSWPRYSCPTRPPFECPPSEFHLGIPSSVPRLPSQLL